MRRRVVERRRSRRAELHAFAWDACGGEITLQQSDGVFEDDRPIVDVQERLERQREFAGLRKRMPWEEQVHYEILRSVMLFGQSPAERALETGADPVHPSRVCEPRFFEHRFPSPQPLLLDLAGLPWHPAYRAARSRRRRRPAIAASLELPFELFTGTNT